MVTLCALLADDAFHSIGWAEEPADVYVNRQFPIKAIPWRDLYTRGNGHGNEIFLIGEVMNNGFPLDVRENGTIPPRPYFPTQDKDVEVFFIDELAEKEDCNGIYYINRKTGEVFSYG